MVTVKVYKLDTPDGAVYVCTDKTLERLRRDGSEAATVALQRFESIVPLCDVEEYAIRAYTFGERLQAEWECTDWSTGEPRLNTSRFTLALLARVLGISTEEVEAMHPQLGQLLWAEVQFLSTPNPFVWTFSSSRQRDSEMDTTPADAPK